MTIGMIRAGGRFLSDDAILLRSAPDGIDALTLRKPFSVNAERAADYPDLVPRLAQLRSSDLRRCHADASASCSLTTPRALSTTRHHLPADRSA